MRSTRLFLTVISALAVSAISASALSFSSIRINATVGTDGPQAIALKDVDGVNGDDIIAVNNTADAVSVYLNQGGGQFDPSPLAFATGVSPVAVVTGDFNNDGHVDLATINDVDNSVTVLLGDGTGQNFTRHDFSVPDTPVALVAGGFDGDRRDDLAVITPDTLYIYKSNTDDTFSSTQVVRTRGTDSISVAAGLFDSDSFLDLAVTNSDANQVVVFLGKGDDTFTLKAFYPVGVSPGQVLATPLSGTTSADLAVVNLDFSNLTQELSFLMSNGDGTFSAPGPSQGFITGSAQTDAVTAADLDSDGLVDLVAAGSSASDPPVIGFVKNCGQDTQQTVRCPAPGNPIEAGFRFEGQVPGLSLAGDETAAAIQSGNLDGQGGPDLLVLAQPNDVIVEFISSSAVVTPTTPSGGSATPTVRTPTPTGPTATPTPTFTASPTPTPTLIPVPYGACNTNDPGQPAIGGAPMAVVIGDFDHDGSKDVAVADKSGNRIVVLMSHIAPTPTPSPGVSKACSLLGLTRGTDVPVNAPVALAAGNFNLDSALDLAVAGSSGLTILLGNPAGGFTAGDTYALSDSQAPLSLAVADFNRDGSPDIIVANGSTNVFLFMGRENGTFQACAPIDVQRNATIIVAKDFDGDRQPDFAIANDQVNTVSMFLRKAPTATPTGTPVASPTVPASGCLSASDFSLMAQLDPRAVPRAILPVNDISPELAVALSWFPPPGTPLPGGSPTPGRVMWFENTANPGQTVNYVRKGPLIVPTPNGGHLEAAPAALGSGDASIPPDHRADLVVADRNNDTVVVFFGDTQGSFGPGPRPVPLHDDSSGVHIPALPVAITMGDIDGDGTDDVVTANSGDGSVSILLSAGRPPTPTPPPTSTASATMTPTATTTPPPPDTPTNTPTPTRTRPPTETSIPTTTGTPRGVITVNGSCAVDPMHRQGDLSMLILFGVAIGAWARRPRARRGLTTTRLEAR